MATRPDLETDYRPPANADEKRLVQIWESVLGVTPIGVEDDFFDLGGDSITAVLIQFSIAEQCDVNLPMTLLFECPNIKLLAKIVRDSTA